MTSKRFNLERITAVFFLILGISVVVNSRELDYWASYGPGAGFFPFWVGIALIITSLYLSVKSTDGPMLSLTPQMKKLLLFIGSFFVCILVLPHLGCLITFSIFLSVTLKVISGANLANVVKITGGMLLFIQLIFSNLLKIPLPKGILPF